MQYTKSTQIIQELPTGDSLNISSYTFTGAKSGPKIYLQANLHGPEILGTGILSRIIRKMDEVKDFPGSLIIVPCANPMGVLNSGYNSMGGRWNQHSGQNWNRIFYGDSDWKSFEEEKEYHKSILQKPNLSIEKKLSSTLNLLSSGANYLIDIHTTGYTSIDHIFTTIGMESIFLHLGTNYQFSSREITKGQGFYGSKTKTFAVNLSNEERPKGCTWEAGSHNIIDLESLNTQTERLWNWLQFIWGNIPNLDINPGVFKTTQLFTLMAEKGGYYIFSKKLGDVIAKDEVYAQVYRPLNDELVEIKAPFEFELFSTFGTGAIGSGEWIGQGLKLK